MPRHAIFIAVALAVGHAPTALAQDASWSRFRGPNGTGIAETSKLPVEIGPEKNVVWKTPLPPGHSSPVLSKTSVFLTAFEGEKLWTLALDRRDGRVLWRRHVQRERMSKLDHRNNAAAPTPAVDEDVVVAFFNDFGLVAYDHSGRELWRRALGPFDNEYGMGASPVIHRDRVFLACDQSLGSFLLCVSKRKGHVLWRVERRRAASGHSTPILHQPEEGPAQLILPGSFLLDAYDTRTGERVWWVSGLSFEMKSVPALHDGVLYINGYGSPLNDRGHAIPPFGEARSKYDRNDDGLIAKDEMPASRAAAYFDVCDRDRDGTHGEDDWEFMRACLASRNGLLAITVGGHGDMTEKSVRWTYRRSIPQLPSPLVYGGILYALHDQGGRITTLRPETGEVIERGRIKGALDNHFASPVAGDGKIYFVSESGLVSVLKIGGSLEPLAVNDLDEPCYATPAIADGRLLLRTASALYCFGLTE